MIRDAVRDLFELSDAVPWVSWVFHGVLAIPMTLLLGPTPVVVFYWLREGQEILTEWTGFGWASAYGTSQRMDHFMDAFVPAAVAAIVTLIRQ